MSNLPICGGSSPNPQWNCVGSLPGALLMSAMYAAEGNGQWDGSSVNSVIASVVSFGFLQSTLTCKQSFIAQQTTEIDCTSATLGNAVATNPNCIACKNEIKVLQDLRANLEIDAHAANPSYVPQVPNPALVALLEGTNGSDGACRFICLQCVAEDVNQNLQMQITADCQTNTKSYISAFSSGMSSAAEAQLSAHQDALKKMGYQIQSQGDIQTLAIQMADAITQMTTTTSLNSLQQQALNIQRTIIEPESTSIVLQHVNQSISVNMFSSLASSVYNDARVKDAIDFKQNQQLISVEESFTSLINSLSSTVSTMDQLLVSIVGKILIAVVALLLTGLLVFAAFIQFSQRPIDQIFST